MSFNTSDPSLKTNIAMASNGVLLSPTGTEAGAHAGGLPNSTAGLVTQGLPGPSLSPLFLY